MAADWRTTGEHPGTSRSRQGQEEVAKDRLGMRVEEISSLKSRNDSDWSASVLSNEIVLALT